MAKPVPKPKQSFEDWVAEIFPVLYPDGCENFNPEIHRVQFESGMTLADFEKWCNRRAK